MTLRPGLYDALVSERIAEELEDVAEELRKLQALDSGDSAEHFARHLQPVLLKALRAASKGKTKPRRCRGSATDLANRILETAANTVPDAFSAGSRLTSEDRRLAAVGYGRLPDGTVAFPMEPEISVAQSALLVNARDQPRIGTEVARELDSADRVDLLCAFIKWTAYEP